MYESGGRDDTQNTSWLKLMNVILENKTHDHMQHMVYYNNNEYEISNRNMPFMFKNQSLNDATGAAVGDCTYRKMPPRTDIEEKKKHFDDD